MPPKPNANSLVRTSLLLFPPVAIVYGIHRGLTYLEAKYPPLPPERTTSIALRTPSKPSTQRCAYVDVYAARIPLRILERKAKSLQNGRTKISCDSKREMEITSQDLQEAWARAVLRCRILRAQEKLLSLFNKDNGSLNEANNDALDMVFVVERTPAVSNNKSSSQLDSESEFGYLVSWKMAPEPRGFFEKISQYGYPWRLMSGGRHELSVSHPFPPSRTGEVASTPDDVTAEQCMVEVRFASAHDYEVVPAEGELEDQKTIPKWTGRLHRGYARLLLDQAVRELEVEDSEGYHR